MLFAPLLLTQSSMKEVHPCCSRYPQDVSEVQIHMERQRLQLLCWRWFGKAASGMIFRPQGLLKNRWSSMSQATCMASFALTLCGSCSTFWWGTCRIEIGAILALQTPEADTPNIQSPNVPEASAIATALQGTATSRYGCWKRRMLML